MKKIVIFCLLATLATFFFSCNEIEDGRTLSYVRQPDQKTLNLTNRLARLDKTNISPTEFRNLIYSSNPCLDWDVIRELTKYQEIDPGERVILNYNFYENNSCEMENKDGVFSIVRLRNELVVEVIRPKEESFSIVPRCLNIVKNIYGKPSVSVEAIMGFSIGRGHHLSDYLPNKYWQIKIAETFGLPVFHGKEFLKRNEIPLSQAWQLINENGDTVQINVYIEPLWEFSLKGEEWRLNNIPPKLFKEGFSPNYKHEREIDPPDSKNRHPRNSK